MRRVVNGVDEAPGAHGFGGCGDAGHIVDGADRVRRVADGDDLRLMVDQGKQLVDVERAVLASKVGDTDNRTGLLQGLPGGEVGVVIEIGQHDLIAGLELPPQGAAERESQAGHVGTENGFVCVTAEEVGSGLVGCGNDLVGALAREKRPVGVGVGVDERIADGVDNALRDLRTARSIQKDDGRTGDLKRQGGKLRADPSEVETVFHVHDEPSIIGAARSARLERLLAS